MPIKRVSFSKMQMRYNWDKGIFLIYDNDMEIVITKTQLDVLIGLKEKVERMEGRG